MEFIVCPGCGQRVQPDQGHRCPHCHTFLHPDPLRRREADFADRFRHWFIEELPELEWLRPPDVDFAETVRRMPLEALISQIGGDTLTRQWASTYTSWLADQTARRDAALGAAAPQVGTGLVDPKDIILKVLVFQDARQQIQQVVRRYVGGDYPYSPPTVGAAYATRRLAVYIGQRQLTLKLQILVMGREKRFRFILPKFCFYTNAAIYAFNLDDDEGFADVGQWVDTMKANTKSIPGVLVGILPEGKPVRAVTADAIDAFDKPYQLPYVEITPTTDITPMMTQLSLEMLQYKLSREGKLS